jgi:hypothetical protein
VHPQGNPRNALALLIKERERFWQKPKPGWGDIESSKILGKPHPALSGIPLLIKERERFWQKPKPGWGDEVKNARKNFNVRLL